MDSTYKASYAPELENLNAIAMSCKDFQRSQLSDATLIKHAIYWPSDEATHSDLTCQADIMSLKHTDNEPLYEFFFVHKYLIHNPQDQVPEDANKLRISDACFQALATRLMMPPAFVFALSCHYLPNGRGSRKVQINQSTAFDFWYFLPIRVQVGSGPSHPGKPDDAPGANQMNPFHELHLPGAKVDIRQSCVGIFSRVEPASKRVTFVAFDFMHGRWPKVALEPRQRIDEVMKHKKNTSTEYADGYFIHLVYLSSATRWFRNALNSCNEQLIAYELQLQTELNCEQATPEAVLTDINRALHSIAAHLHRYLSELKSSQGIVVDLSTYYESIYTSETADSDLGSFEQASRGLSQVSSQIEALRDFAEELEKKIKNILALLFSRIQISSDRLLVANGQAMQAILSAMQEDATLGRKMAKASHALAEEMRRDSVAMRTIAVVTMFFLPGATFAALLSMPFFSSNKWLSDISRFWIWIVVTVPSTCACFIFYQMWGSRAHIRSPDDDISLENQPQTPGDRL